MLNDLADDPEMISFAWTEKRLRCTVRDYETQNTEIGHEKRFAFLSICLASGNFHVLCAKRVGAGTVRQG